MLVSVIIPVAPAHKNRLSAAVDSVKRQTIKSGVEILISHDPARTGAAATRNRAIAKARGLFCVFLDADDELHPEYLERALNAYRRGLYVYTDWQVNGEGHRVGELYRENKKGVPLQIWSTGQTHLITCLIPTAAIRAVGGFDESLEALEDEDLFFHLHAIGLCGIRVPLPLVNYNRKHGGGNVNAENTNALERSIIIGRMETLFKERYRRFFHMGCKDCIPPKIVNEAAKQKGDILVYPLYTPRKMPGAATGRLYPKTGMHQTMWISKQDYEATPGRWSRVPDAKSVTPDVDKVKKLTEEALKRADEDPETEEINPDETPTEKVETVQKKNKAGRKSSK